MRRFIAIALIIVVLLLIAILLRTRAGGEDPSAYAGTTQMTVSGPMDAIVTGYYIRDGQRIAISNALPWSFEGDRVSRLELRKANPADTLVVEMRYDGNGAHARMKKPLGAGMPGIRVQVQNGLISETLVQRE